MGHWHFLNSTGDRGNIKRQRHATLAFLRIDMQHQHPPSRAPLICRSHIGVQDIVLFITPFYSTIFIFLYMSPQPNRHHDCFFVTCFTVCPFYLDLDPRWLAHLDLWTEHDPWLRDPERADDLRQGHGRDGGPGRDHAHLCR